MAQHSQDCAQWDGRDYVCVVLTGEKKLLMLSQTNAHNTLPLCDVDAYDTVTSIEYRAEVCRRLGIQKAHTHIVEEKFFCEGVAKGDMVKLTIVEISSETFVVHPPLVWVDWWEACNQLAATCKHTFVAPFVRKYLRHYESGTTIMEEQPWLSLGYYRKILPHLKRELAEKGYNMNGEPEQVRCMIRSVHYRIPTAHGYIFFKAIPKGSKEILLTQIITELFPEQTAYLLGTIPELNATLTLDFGPTLGEILFSLSRETPVKGYEDHKKVSGLLLKQWAECQQHSVQFIDKLKTAGVPVYDESWMEKGLEDILQYTKEHDVISPEMQDAVSGFKVHVASTFRLFKESGIPQTLVHGDLHIYNVAQTDGPGSMFLLFDWDMAFIGCPFFDLVDSVLCQAEDTYLESWKDYTDMETARRLAKWTVAVGCLKYAIVFMRSPFFGAEECQSDVQDHLEFFVESVTELLEDGQSLEE